MNVSTYVAPNSELRAEKLGAIHEGWSKVHQNKMSKEMLQAKLQSIVLAATMTIVGHWIHEAGSKSTVSVCLFFSTVSVIFLKVHPWAESSSTSIESRSVFSPPDVETWAAYKHLSVLEVYKPAKAALDNLSLLSKLLLATSGDGGDLQNLHKTIKSCTESVDLLQACR